MFRDIDDEASYTRSLTFTEPTQDAAVVRLYLDFLVDGRIEVPDDGTTVASLSLVQHLVGFMITWKCTATLSLLLNYLREIVRQPSSISPLVAFIAAAEAGDAFTASIALDITDWTWSMMEQRLRAFPEANVFDPHHMPVAVWKLIPPMYTWALTSAWTSVEEEDREMKV